MKIRYQSVVPFETAALYRASLEDHLRRIAGADTAVTVCGAEEGVWAGLEPAEVSGFPYVFHNVTEKIVLDAALAAEREGYDALIIGSSTEPGLRLARSSVDIPVASLMESSLLVASTLGGKIGLIAPSEEVASILQANLEARRLTERVLPIEVLTPKLYERELEAAFQDPQFVLQRFVDCASGLVARGADAIIAAEGMLAEIVALNGLHELNGAAVLDPVGVAVAFAEMQVRLRVVTGLRTSRRWYYRKPPPHVFQALARR